MSHRARSTNLFLKIWLHAALGLCLHRSGSVKNCVPQLEGGYPLRACSPPHQVQQRPVGCALTFTFGPSCGYSCDPSCGYSCGPSSSSFGHFYFSSSFNPGCGGNPGLTSLSFSSPYFRWPLHRCTTSAAEWMVTVIRLISSRLHGS